MPWSGPTSGLIHRWPLDLANLSGGVDSDVVGSISITESGGVANAAGPSGTANTARSFNGTTGTGTFASSPLPASGPYTVSIWGMLPDINAGGGTATAQTMVNLGTNSGGNAIRVVEDNGSVNSQPGGFSWRSQLTFVETVASPFVNNQWLQVAVTFDGASTYQTVVNGTVVATAAHGPGGPAASDVIASRDTTSSFTAGSLAQLAIYNRVLTSVELTQLYNADAAAPVIILPLASQGTAFM